MARQNHIINGQYLSGIGRPIGRIPEDQLDAFITEAEQMYVKPALGENLFIRLLDIEKAEKDEALKILLDGGIYSDSDGHSHSFVGLRMAMSYYVYAQNVMTGDFQSTRYGMVVKDNDYSSHISSKERSDAYNNALEVANTYLKDCIVYCRSKCLVKKSESRVSKAGGIVIRKIG